MSEPEDHETLWNKLFELAYALRGWIQRLAPSFEPDDIIQEVMLKLLRSHPDPTTIAAPRTYVRTVVRSVIIDRVRREHTNDVAPIEGLTEGEKKELERPSIEKWLTDMERERSQEALAELASELKPRDQLVVKAWLQKTSWEDMAGQLGTTVECAQLLWASVLAKLHYIAKKKAKRQGRD